jgi:hypothetical protein
MLRVERKRLLSEWIEASVALQAGVGGVHTGLAAPRGRGDDPPDRHDGLSNKPRRRLGDLQTNRIAPRGLGEFRPDRMKRCLLGHRFGTRSVPIH